MSAARFRWYAREARRAVSRLEADRRLRQRFPNAALERDVTVVSPNLLTLGNDVLVQHGTLLHCGGLEWSQGRGGIELGDGCTICHHAVLWGAGTITFKDRAAIAPGAMIFSSQSRYATDPDDPDATHFFAPVVLEEDVRVYANSIINIGVTIGRGAVVGANTLVLEDVAPYTFVAGNPAKVVREMDPASVPPLRRSPGT